MSVVENKNKGPLAWMANNSVAANLMMIVFLVGGLILARSIKQEVFPEFSLDIVTVTVPYPGASPEEVEQGIVLVVEEAVTGLDGVKKVSSSADEGVGRVIIEAIEGYNLDKLSQDVKNEVDRISSFPQESEKATVKAVSRKRQVLSLMVHGNEDQLTLRKLAEDLRNELMDDPGITQVDLSEVSGLQISIEIPDETLRKYNLTLKEVATKLGQASVELPGGGIKTSAGEILVRVKDRRDYAREFARIPVVTGVDGTQVLLEDIATVKEDFQDEDKETYYDGEQAVRIDVFRIGKQTPITVSDAVHKQIAKFNKRLPAGVKVDVRNDLSDIFNQRLNLLLKNGVMGLVLVFITLALFLEPRLAFWVAMGIPISFLGSMVFLSPWGASINMISMFAFIISLGIVVDDAIVVGENVYTMRQKGMSWIDSACIGAKQIAMPVTFSVLTNIAAFMPLFFLPGVMGKLFKIIPMVVVSVFAVSLIESLFVLPAHLAHGSEKEPGKVMKTILFYQQKVAKWLLKFINTKYRPFLDRAIALRYVTVAIGFAILIVSFAYIKSGRLGFTLFPKVESDYTFLTVDMPYGTDKIETKKVMVKALKALHAAENDTGEENLIKGIFSKIGGAGRKSVSGSNVLKVQAFLGDPDLRNISTDEFTKIWRRKLGTIVGAESVLFESDRGGPGAGNAIEVELTHTNLNVLEDAAKDLAAELKKFPNVSDIDDGYRVGKRQLDFEMLPEGRSLGLTAKDVASQVRSAYYGAEVLRQQRGRNEVKVMVRYPKDQRVTEYSIEEMVIKTPQGTYVPLREVVKIKDGRAYTSIDRTNGKRITLVAANVNPRKETSKVIAALTSDILPQLKANYPGLGYNFEGQQADLQESTGSLFRGLLFAMLAIYALLAIPFKSYSQPVIIMLCIPFGVVGAVLGHIMLGYSLSLMSLFGIVALSGVVVNDSLVFIDTVNIKRREGQCAYDAILDAGTSRFRPILLTTLTTFGGLAPMIAETSVQARFLIPMAISLGFGIVFATFITLVLVPAFYLILEDIKSWFRVRFSS